jgi:hypothetical protein
MGRGSFFMNGLRQPRQVLLGPDPKSGPSICTPGATRGGLLAEGGPRAAWLRSERRSARRDCRVARTRSTGYLQRCTAPADPH